MAGGGHETVIVGGAGFIGSHLVAARLRQGDRVHVVVRGSTRLDRLRSFRDAVTLHAVDLRDRAGMAAVFAQLAPDTVYYLAASDRREPLPNLGDVQPSIDDIASFTALVAACAAAKSPPRAVVRAGSLAEYGPGCVPYVETQRELPTTAYAAAMTAGTYYARMMAPRLPFALTTARLALLYGPGQSDRFLVPTLIANCLAGRPSIVRRPHDRRDLMHVDDAVAGLQRLAERPVEPVVNLSTGHAPTMVEIAARICAATGADPELLELGPRDPPGGVRELRGSAKLARHALGWSPQITLDEGIERTVDWYRGFVRGDEIAA